MVLIDKIPPHDRPLVQRMLDDEIDRQKRLKAELAQDPKTSAWIEDKRLFQNYKQLQFFDTLALYFNRTHPRERGEVKFEHVPSTHSLYSATGPFCSLLVRAER